MAGSALNEGLVRARVDLAALADTLTAEHGLCRIDVELVPSPGRVEIRGVILVDGLRRRVCETVERCVPRAVAVVDAMTVVSGGPWRSIPAALVLRSEAGGGVAVTELCPADGPVELLGQVRAGCLVRDRSGTAGWTTSERLGARVSPPRLPEPRSRDPERFVAAALGFVDTPYRLGGTGTAGVDCSGLVQRVARDALGVVVPRHSADQRSIGAADTAWSFGGLAFVWSPSEPHGHVGIVDRHAVVHASLSRGRVVRDSVERFSVDATRRAFVAFERILELGDRCAGASSLLAAGFRLGGSDALRRPTRTETSE